MTSWLNSLNPSPAFPAFTGPYTVGTFDVELPVSGLEDGSSPTPDPDVTTISFRVFYPCPRNSGPSRPVRWVQQPQNETIAAYARFLGASPNAATWIARFPHLLYYTTIPAIRNAKLESSPNASSRWPVMVFSHGLSGSKNCYSHYCGSMASHGMVVIAPDHRDCSQPISFIRATETTEAKIKYYNRMSHEPTDEVYQGRDTQLKTRIWELGLVHEALLKMDKGQKLKNLDENRNSKKEDTSFLLDMFKNALDIHRPGSITWAGHSFGACTTVQLLKSVFYQDDVKSPITTARQNALQTQITPDSPTILLDLWTLPLTSPYTSELWSRPLPCFSKAGPGGSHALAIMSESFVKWSANMKTTQKVMRDPTAQFNEKFSRSHGHIFYPLKSAHLGQSDFGLLFPRLTKYLAHAEEPLRTMQLNVRACLAMLRNADVAVADTKWEDLEDPSAEKGSADWKILDRTEGLIRGWVFIKADEEVKTSKDTETAVAANSAEANIQKAMVNGGKV